MNKIIFTMKRNIFLSLTIVILAVIFLSGCKPQETKTSGLLEYKNTDLGISFKYTSDFKVYNPNEDKLRIESDYKKPDSNLLYIGDKPIAMAMNINRINTKPQTSDDTDYAIRIGKLQIMSRYKIDDYELIKLEKIEGEDKGSIIYHIISDKGTFAIYDSMFWYKTNLQKDGLYQDYRAKFDEILKSIKII